MPVFKNIKELKRDLVKKELIAVKQAQEYVYNLIDNYLQQYYSDYDPTVYERTRQLLHSLVKSNVKRINGGYEASVYFDLSKMDYSYKLVNGIKKPNHGWSAEATMETAGRGEHGGKVVVAEGAAIWADPIAIFQHTMINPNKLKEYLEEMGVPLK